MLKIRVIPTLLLKNNGLVKTIRFKNPKYVGDPINAVKIFNDKEVDELALIDIEATKLNKKPNFDLLSKICREAFMPLSYGGGIKTIEDAKKLLSLGFEKIIINTALLKDNNFIIKIADICGSQSIVASIDVKKNMFGRNFVYMHSKRKNLKWDPIDLAKKAEELGAGEILINSVDREGTMAGYDLKLISRISKAVSIPTIAVGGAGNLMDFVKAVEIGGASAVSAGSLFVFHGPHRAVLITYPEKKQLKELFGKNT
jgi:cyclase